MNNIRELDPLRRENWSQVYADVPEEVDLGVRLAFARIRRHEMRKKRTIRILSAAACIALAVGVCAAGLSSRKTTDPTDVVAAPPVEKLVLCADDIVLSSAGDPCFHVYSACSHVGETAVELPLVTALEFEKTLCETCGVNAVIQE